MEIWKTIEGTENHYEVSNLGNFKLDGKPIDTVIDSTGYVKVRIAFPIGTRWRYRNIFKTRWFGN